ncbi:serine hydrolase [Microbacterium luticocti]|uniref:serine hydrolase n=1 Tax=Microbacterium luticocti TaxID=451764 RepID=UPI000403F637|nr:serine hydrolase [Microbacterium luticocti]
MTAQTTRPARIDDYLDVVVPASPVTRADGTTVFTLTGADRAADRATSELWLVPADGPARRLTTGPGDTAPTWNPVTGDIVFLREDAAGRPQVHVITADGAEARALTTLPHGAGAPVVSPDGRRVAFAAPVDRGSGDPLVARGLSYKVDGAGLRNRLRTHLFELALDTGVLTRLTDGDWDASEPAYAPDGTTLAFSAAITRDEQLGLRSRVRLLDLGVPTFPITTVGSAAAVHAPLAFTPDGTGVLAVGAAEPGIRHAGLWLLPLDGAGDLCLTASLDRNVMPGGTGYPGGRPAVTDDGTVVFCLREGGSTHVWATDLTGAAPRPVVIGEQTVVSGLAVAAGRVRVVRADATGFGELVEYPLHGPGEPRVLTDAGARTAGIDFPRYRSRHFTISDGTVVEAFLAEPAATSPDGTDSERTPGPLVLDVHGGPHNAWTGTLTTMHPYHAELVARGYTVLMVNPRGSDGYGEAFFTAVHDGWGDADLPDLLEPVDALIAEGVADPRQLVVTGYSYGGFMTAALTARTDRFAAAVAGGLVCDLAHPAGDSDEGIVLQRFEFDPDSGRARALSPLEHVQDVTAPTLVLHGGADQLCPVHQAEQWHAGLVLAGVPSELVLYPGEAHAFILTGRPSHRADYSRRVVSWFERHLSPTPARAGIEPARWQNRLETIIAKYSVPGASLGILTTTRSGPEVHVVTAGVLNTRTGARVQPDSLFQIGSISKVWTAVLIMQLVAEGRLDLDAPVRDVLPELRVADEHVAATVTIRQLLTHTSGIDGDVFIDTGRGDDTVARYVAALGEVAQNFAPGEDWSYCNTGFVILGRIVEVCRQAVWDDVLRERILTPLGLAHTTTLPDDILRHSSAVGHDGPDPVTHVLITRSAGPAGLINARAEDVLRFAYDSISPDPVLLGRDDHAAMRTEQGGGHRMGVADRQGLAWMLNDWGGARVHGHDGGTIGQQAFLRVAAEAGVAAVLLTNGGLMGAAANELLADVFAELAGITMPAAPVPLPESAPGADLDAAAARALEGTYRDAAASITLTWDGRTLSGTRLERMNPTGREELVAETSFTVRRAADGTYLAGTAGSPLWAQLWRRDLSGGTVLHFAARAFRKVGDE